MITKITCPKCKNEFEPNEALDSELRAQILASVNEEHQKHVELERKKAIEEAKQKADEENKKKLEEARNQAFDEAKKSINDKYATDLEFLKKQLEEKDQKVKEHRVEELKLRQDKAKIEEANKELELTIQRRVDEEKKRVEQIVSDKLENNYKLKLSEKDQHIESMSKKIDELQKKSNLTSQQLQGEVLELAIQQALMEAFPDDDITEIEKFKNGSDIKELVRSRKGMPCGKILWECKRTNLFKTDFIVKLKEDMLHEEAQFGIIVTTTLPKQAIHGMAQIDGIWVCSQAFVEYLGIILRESLISVAREKWIHENKGNKGDQLIAYFSSTQFAQQASVFVESQLAQKGQINKERTVLTKVWADREAQLDRQTRSFAKILSSIQDFVGPGMQQIGAFDLLTLEESQA
jgi:hypothetical protein